MDLFLLKFPSFIFVKGFWFTIIKKNTEIGWTYPTYVSLQMTIAINKSFGKDPLSEDTN